MKQEIKVLLETAIEFVESVHNGEWGSSTHPDELVISMREALAQPPLPVQPAQESEILTIAYQSGFYDGKQAALAGREWNFCERCGKRTADKSVIHTCTPPQGDA